MCATGHLCFTCNSNSTCLCLFAAEQLQSDAAVGSNAAISISWVNVAEIESDATQQRDLDLECGNPPAAVVDEAVTAQHCVSDVVVASDTTKRKRKKITKGSASSKCASDDATPCMYCEVSYNESNCKWYMCRRCEQWACASCACVGRGKVFVCSTCK
jgi:hypothetical protein